MQDCPILCKDPGTLGQATAGRSGWHRPAAGAHEAPAHQLEALTPGVSRLQGQSQAEGHGQCAGGQAPPLHGVSCLLRRPSGVGPWSPAGSAQHRQDWQDWHLRKKGIEKMINVAVMELLCFACLAEMLPCGSPEALVGRPRQNYNYNPSSLLFCLAGLVGSP